MAVWTGCRRPSATTVPDAPGPRDPSEPRDPCEGTGIPTDLVAAVREFTGAILNPFDLDDLLHRLMGHTTEVMVAAGAGIMLAQDNGGLAFVAASEQRVVDVELHQAQVGQGACHEAFAINEIVRVDDIRDEDRWPDYVRLVEKLGLRAVLGVPLNAFGQTIGVINVYREQPTVWSEEDIGAAQILASMGAGYILNANQLKAQHTLSEQLHTAIGSRDLIGQAKGIIMTQAQLTSDEAFEQLRRRSQATNRKLREIAQEVVDHQSQAATPREGT
jgi:GAF domain-containing protein